MLQFARANVKFERPKANGRAKLAVTFQWVTSLECFGRVYHPHQNYPTAPEYARNKARKLLLQRE